eukprot:scaffold65652_cov71-Phaeocystis_antarctica.AAC.10
MGCRARAGAATPPEAREAGGGVAGATARRGARSVHRDEPRTHGVAEVDLAQLEIAREARGEEANEAPPVHDGGRKPDLPHWLALDAWGRSLGCTGLGASSA